MGDSSYAMTSFENVQSAYQSAFQGEYIRKIENGMGTAAAQAIISAELKKVQASSVQSVRDRTAFAVAVQQRLISADASPPKMTQNVNTDTVMAILAALYTPQDEVAVDQSNRQEIDANAYVPFLSTSYLPLDSRRRLCYNTGRKFGCGFFRSCSSFRHTLFGVRGFFIPASRKENRWTNSLCAKRQCCR